MARHDEMSQRELNRIRCIGLPARSGRPSLPERAAQKPKRI